MIYIDLKGNLGNQLFEYAFARKLQMQTGQKIIINTAFMTKYKPEYHCNLQHYILNDNVSFEHVNFLPQSVNTYEGVVRYVKRLFPKSLLKHGMKNGKIIWMKESFVNLNIDLTLQDYYLVGYWQSAKYFQSIDSVLRKEFTPKYSVSDHNLELLNKIRTTESICVTIRRGDYVTNEKYKKIFFLCDTNYFLKGIELIRTKIPHAPVFCFSDDIEWVKKNIKINGEVYYENGHDAVYEKLLLMSNCKHFVISNSSFSWWAQHLSENYNKLVYAPQFWYPDKRKCDIYEPNWNYIDPFTNQGVI